MKMDGLRHGLVVSGLTIATALQAVKKEVNLVKEMDIVVVDGLDSVEQRKVLSVLDTVHTLFSDPGSPFIILLAIDPHVITKAIELKLNQVSSYLRNMVHGPSSSRTPGCPCPTRGTRPRSSHWSPTTRSG